MKKIAKLLLIALLFIKPFVTSGQVFCDTIILEAINYYHSDSLSKALDELKKAEICDYQNVLLSKRQVWQDSIFNAIERQTLRAMNATLAEKKATQRAKRAERLALDEKNKAILEKDKAVSERKRADDLKIIAEQQKEIAQEQKKLAEREAAISKAGLAAQQADIAIGNGAFEKGFQLALSAIQLAKHENFTIPPLAYQSFGEAVYKATSLGYKKSFAPPTNSSSLIYWRQLPHKNSFFMAYDDKSLLLQHLDNGSNLKQVATGNFLLDFQVSPKGNQIVVGQDDGIIQLWDIEKNKITPIQAHSKAVLGSCFSNDGAQFLTWSRENKAKLWTNQGLFIKSFEEDSPTRIYQGSFSRQDDKILLRTSDWKVKMWSKLKETTTEIKHNSYATYAVFSPNGQQIVSCSSDSTAILLTENNGELMLPHNNSVIKACFSKAGDKILTVDLDNKLRIWDVSGKLLAQHNTEFKLTQAVFSLHEAQVVYWGANNKVYFWDFKEDKISKRFIGHLAEIISVQMSENGAYYLTHCKDKKAKLWDEKGQLLLTLNHDSSLPPLLTLMGQNVISTPDGRTLEITENPMFILNRLAIKG